MRKLLLAATSGLALAAGMAHAQVTEVIVTGYLEEDLPAILSEAGTSVDTVPAADILNAGFVDVGQTLQSLMPSLYIAPLSGPFDYLDASYQGSRNVDLLWLVDGVRLNNRLYSTTPPLDTIPAHMVERVELVEGGQALFYGTAAIAGAVNIVTRGFTDTPEGMVRVGAGSGEERHISGFVSDTLGIHQFVIYGSSDQANGFQPFPDADYEPSSTDRRRSYDSVTLGGKYGINLGPDARLSVNYQHTSAKLDFARPFDVAEASNERDEDIVSAKIDWAPSEQFEFFFKGYYHWWDTLYNQTDNDLLNPGSLIVISDDEFWGFEDYGLNGVARYAPGGPVEFFAGYDYQSYSGEDQVFLIAPQTESVHAPFGQIRTTDAFLPNVVLAAGIRHNMPSDGESSTIWNVNGRWDITDSLFLRGSAGTAFRLPDAYELYVVDPCCEQGNPNLTAERSLNFNASLGGTFGMDAFRLNWEVTGFSRDIKDRIIIVFDPDLGIDTFDNSGTPIETRGAEIILGAEVGDVFSADFSYTFNSTEVENTDVQIQDIPESLWKANFDYHPMDLPIGASVSLLHVGDVYRNALGRQEYGDYTVVNVGARVYFGADRQHRLGLNLLNAFDEEYVTRIRVGTRDDSTSYPYHFLGKPRTIHVNYTYEFGM